MLGLNKLVLLIPILFVGCAKPKVEIQERIVYQTKYQEKLVPVKCVTEMPNKPIYDPNFPETFKDLMLYYNNVENKLYFCITGKNIDDKNRNH